MQRCDSHLLDLSAKGLLPPQTPRLQNLPGQVGVGLVVVLRGLEEDVRVGRGGVRPGWRGGDGVTGGDVDCEGHGQVER